MKITVTHSTVYRYDFPVYLDPHIFRLRPCTNSAQRLLAVDLRIAPLLARATECLDQDGTLALNAWFNTPTQELSVLSSQEGSCRGLAVSNSHAAVAAGFDPDLAAPVAGWYSGGSASRMEASLNLQVDHAA
jgi:hypothetical protein